MVATNSINELFAPVKRAAEELKRRLKLLGYDMGISSTYRDIESQNSIYAQGRTTPGNIVTQAKGGQSYHNYRLAFDVFLNIKGKEYDSTFLQTAGRIGTELGLEWGGSWIGFVDTPHFQWSDGLTIQDLLNGKYPKDKKFPWEEVKIDVPEKPKTYTVSIEEVYLLIDSLKYRVNRVFINDKNYVELRSFEQAGYTVDYEPIEKLASISHP